MTKAEKFLIIIGGPTAVGKTSLAIGVARHFGTQIISCDSRQLYREMNIGTAKPTAEELSAMPHHFIDSLSIRDDYTAGDFERDGLALLNSMYKKQNVVVMTGGSGLFIRALCEGLDDFPEVAPEIQKALEAMLREHGIEALQQELKTSDPVYFENVDVNNPRRLLRALSVCRASGRPFSGFQKGAKARRPFTPVYILLEMERAQLYRRIEQRVDEMMAAGLLEEARKLFPQRQLKALQTVGYQELFSFFENEITLESAVGLIKQNSRRYAKRQMTWFRKDDHWVAFPAGEAEQILAHLERILPGA
jgi:tRNA dimethylallyltransferase